MVKIATRNMFYDETGKHCRTKQEILDVNGKVRPKCKIIPKGQPYEQTIFAAKDRQFKAKKFKYEAQELFTEINNQFIQDPERKLHLFNSNSVYLPTKKIGKNNSKAEYIKADNTLRQKWDLTADEALVRGIPEDNINQIKREQILRPVKESIVNKGTHPELFHIFVEAALQNLSEMIRTVMLPKKPVLKVNLKEFEEMEQVKKELDSIQKKIDLLMQKMEKKEQYRKTLYSPFKKSQVTKEITEILNESLELKRQFGNKVTAKGYRNVQSFMNAYNKAEKVIREYTSDMEIYRNQIRSDEKETMKFVYSGIGKKIKLIEKKANENRSSTTITKHGLYR